MLGMTWAVPLSRYKFEPILQADYYRFSFLCSGAVPQGCAVACGPALILEGKRQKYQGLSSHHGCHPRRRGTAKPKSARGSWPAGMMPEPPT